MKPAEKNPAYETREARVPVVLTGVGALVLLIGMSFATVSVFFHGASRRSLGVGEVRSFRHGAEEKSGIEEDWRAQEAAVQLHLQRYAWVDRAGGFVQIPIDRAMAMIVQESALPAEKTK